MKRINLSLIRTFFIGVLLLALILLAFPLNKVNQELHEAKEDLVELSDIKYGIFNVDTWRDILLQVMSKKISEFQLSPENKDELKEKTIAFLEKEIENFEERYYQDNHFFRSVGASLFGVFTELKRQVPEIAEEILAFVEQPENIGQLKSFVENKVEVYADETFSEVDYSKQNEIILKYQQKEAAPAIEFLEQKVEQLSASLETLKYYLISIAILVAISMAFPYHLLPTKLEMLLLMAICLVLLVLGLYLPMIEIDARISQFNFTLLEESISFENQVIYHNVRSIFGVVKVLFNEKTFDIILVGILIFMFSVLFPISKLIAVLYLILSPQLKSKKIISFLVYKTGKWSMADVMVVAIFMSYIGFTGIVSGQLGELEKMSQNIDILTTNQSSLQLGFYAFIFFVVLSLYLTTKLKSYTEQIRF